MPTIENYTQTLLEATGLILFGMGAFFIGYAIGMSKGIRLYIERKIPTSVKKLWAGLILALLGLGIWIGVGAGLIPLLR